MPIGQRIHVIGNSASGKSTLAARLAEALDAAFVELDALNWLPGWVGLNETNPDEFERRIREATMGERWVVAGSYEKFSQRTFWPRIDTVVWLDLPMPLLLWRALRRSWKRWRSRELIWGTNYERFWPQLMIWRKNYSLLRMDHHPACPQEKRHDRAPVRSALGPHSVCAALIITRGGGVSATDDDLRVNHGGGRAGPALGPQPNPRDPVHMLVVAVRRHQIGPRLHGVGPAIRNCRGVRPEEFKGGSIRRTYVEIEQTAVFGLWGEHVPRTVSGSGPESPSGTRDFDLVLVETFDETPHLLAGPLDRSDRTFFD